MTRQTFRRVTLATPRIAFLDDADRESPTALADYERKIDAARAVAENGPVTKAVRHRPVSWTARRVVEAALVALLLAATLVRHWDHIAYGDPATPQETTHDVR